MENLENLSQIRKEEHSIFDFFINELKEEKETKYIEEILGMPKLPSLGHYNNNDYNLGKILSLVSFQIDICQGSNKDEIRSKYPDFKLPSNIEKYLNVYEKIEIDNNTKKKDTPFFIPKDKLNFYFIISDLPSSSNKFKNKNENSNHLLLNIVPHLYYNKNKGMDFSQSKRFIFEKPIALFKIGEEGDNDISSSGIKNNIDINNLRLEYSSLHLKKGSLAFSPNNLRFNLDISGDLSQFYLIITNNENDYHSVFYYITCNNDKSKEKIKNILKKSFTINEIISNLKNDFSSSEKIINNIVKIFNN